MTPPPEKPAALVILPPCGAPLPKRKGDPPELRGIICTEPRGHRGEHAGLIAETGIITRWSR